MICYPKQVFSVMFYFGIIQFRASFSLYLTTLFEDFKPQNRPFFSFWPPKKTFSLVFMDADDIQVETQVAPGIGARVLKKGAL